VDLTDVEALRELARAHPPKQVIHLAGLLPPAAEADLWRVNVGGTLNLLQALASAKARRVRMLTVGSAAEYLRSSANRIRETDPAGGHTSYGRTKWAQSVLSLAFGAQAGIEVVVARTFNLVGPGVPPTLAPGALCAQFARHGHKTIKVGNLHSRRDFIDIRDAVSAYWKICEDGKTGGIYNVCTGKATSIRTMVQLFSRLAGGRRTIQDDPSRFRRGDLDRVCGDNARLRRLGWSPRIPLERSIRDMLECARSQ
jgi:GDP-4-dehydro-6-deoxy-D-mannose reductase